MRRQGGQTIGPWRLNRLLGSGANAEVWEASNERGDIVAVKVLPAFASLTTRFFSMLPSSPTMASRGTGPNALPSVLSPRSSPSRRYSRSPNDQSPEAPIPCAYGSGSARPSTSARPSSTLIRSPGRPTTRFTASIPRAGNRTTTTSPRWTWRGRVAMRNWPGSKVGAMLWPWTAVLNAPLHRATPKPARAAPAATIAPRRNRRFIVPSLAGYRSVAVGNQANEGFRRLKEAL